MLLSLNSRTETLPSDEAQASRQPDSCGDQEIMFTDAVWRAKSKTFVQVVPVSRQMKTFPSYPALARMLPYFGCAQDTHHTAPSCLYEVLGGDGGKKGEREAEKYPFSVSVSRCWSPSTSKILTVRSEEQVARRRP